MKSFFLEIAYNGTSFHGWQKQPNANSVQAELENALGTVLQQEVETVGCGRTDTGVHATTFFAHVDLKDDPPDQRKFIHSLNALLPNAVAVKELHPVNDKAHARFDAISRSYRYDIHSMKDPFLNDRSYLYSASVAIDRMNEACEHLLGKQEFDSFCKAGADNKTTWCTITEARWERLDVHRIRFHITADRFLRNMVRAIVGTLIDIGRGEAAPDHIKHIIAAKDRGQAGTSVPASGLYLTNVTYPYLP